MVIDSKEFWGFTFVLWENYRGEPVVTIFDSDGEQLSTTHKEP